MASTAPERIEVDGRTMVRISSAQMSAYHELEAELGPWQSLPLKWKRQFFRRFNALIERRAAENAERETARRKREARWAEIASGERPALALTQASA